MIIRIVFRLAATIWVTLIYFVISLETLIGHPWSRLRRRTQWACRCFRLLLRIWGVDVRVEGFPLPTNQSGIVVANHLSYLDIMILYAQRPMLFIAKEGIRHWPLIGWLARYAQVIFIKRDNPLTLRTQIRQIREYIDAGFVLCFFPEGRIGDGEEIRPFHRGLLSLVHRLGRPIFPVVLRYADPRLIWNTPVPLVKHLCRWWKGRTAQAHCAWLPAWTDERLRKYSLPDFLRTIHQEMNEYYQRMEPSSPRTPMDLECRVKPQ